MGLGSQSRLFCKQSYRKSLQESIDTGVPFIDSEFKASEAVVFVDRKFLVDVAVDRIVWKRPLELTREPRLFFREKVCSDASL